MNEIPLTAVAVLPRPSPVCEGDTDTLCSIVAAVELAASECQAYATDATDALTDSRGEAVRALTRRVSHLKSSAGLVEQSSVDAELAMRQYGQTVTEVHTKAGVVEQEVLQALGRIRDQKSVIDELCARHGLPIVADWRTPPSLFMPATADRPFTISGDVDSFNWQIAAGAWAGAVATISDSVAQWNALVAQRESAERALVGSLSRTAIVAQGPGAGAPQAAVTAAMILLLSPERPWESVPVRRLLSGTLSPAEVAAQWKQIAAEGGNLDELIANHSFELARLDGLPFSVRDRAARAALEYALSSSTGLTQAFTRLGLSSTDTTPTELRRDLIAIRDAIGEAEAASQPGATVQLVALGSHDGAVTAAISIGDLDTAERVGVLVSGMNSNVRGLGEAIPGLNEIKYRSGDSALVSWIGYRAPGVTEEPFQNRAERGSWPLATFLDGVSATRGATPPDRFALIGHSYGTNVAAEALKLGGHGVDAFVSIGSAGLKVGTKSEDLGVDEIHASHAKGDNVAQVGRQIHFRPTTNGGPGYIARVDPRDLEGAVVFSSEESADGKRVTMHNLTRPINWGAAQWAADRFDGVASADEIGYLNPGSSTTKYLSKIMGEK